jgi:hypothetical protein
MAFPGRWEARNRGFASHVCRPRGAGFNARPADFLKCSITHCAGYAVAAAARAGAVRTVGLDAEPDQPLPTLVLGAVTLPSERDMLRELATADPGISWDGWCSARRSRSTRRGSR